jgi:Tfp pilus assembly protein PilX
MNASDSTKGFVLPVAIGVGLIAILLGIMVVARSSQNRITATAQKETARSLAAAESGITQFQSLFNRYRPLSTYCSSNAAPAPTSCGAVTWQTVKDSDLAGSEVCEKAAATLVKDYADDFTNNQWQNVSTNPSDGQFRLISYFYKPNAASASPFLPGIGELTLEGRVNQNSDNTASNRTSVTRIQIQFPVTNLPPNSADVPGLWVSSGADSTITDPEVQLKTNIRDSACTPAVSTTLQAKQPSSPSSPPYEYQTTPGNYFPLMPAEGSSPPATNVTGFYNISSPIDGPEEFPRIGDTDSNDVYTYRVAANKTNNRSIDVTGGQTIFVGEKENVEEKEKTVVLYLEGGINVENSQIIVTPGSRLIIYAHGPVTLSNASFDPIEQIEKTEQKVELEQKVEQQVEQKDTYAAEKVQLYVYPSSSDPAPSVTIGSGSASKPMQLLLLAPQSQVVFSTAAQVKGIIWAKSWKGDANSVLEQASTDLSNAKIIFPRIAPITLWQRLAIP